MPSLLCQCSLLNRWLLKVGLHPTAAYLWVLPIPAAAYSYFSALSSPPVRLRPWPSSILCQQQTVPAPVCPFSSNNHSIFEAFFRLNSRLILLPFEKTNGNVAFGFMKGGIFQMAHPNENEREKSESLTFDFHFSLTTDQPSFHCFLFSAFPHYHSHLFEQGCLAVDIVRYVKYELVNYESHKLYSQL